MRPEELTRSPNLLAEHYTHFRVSERMLLTGHSHQAWPDRALEGYRLAWRDAAAMADRKWGPAFEKAERVRRGYAELLVDDPGNFALAQNTHELLVRFLSALPLQRRPRVVTTTGEFHTIRRQLGRLEEEGLEVVRVPTEPTDALTERLADQVDDRTAAVLVSSVLFENAAIVPGLNRVAAACHRSGVPLLVDGYHHLNVVPFSVREMGLEDAYVVGGGYKYCQLGEGNAFLRFPPDTSLRPVVTGWFAEFGVVVEGGAAAEGERGAEVAGPKPVPYGEGPVRFAGATYDPVSHYRAAEVFDFFQKEGLDPGLLRKVSQHQVGLLVRRFDELDANPNVVARDGSISLSGTAGFLALRSPYAGRLVELLREAGVHSDHRGEILRLGPAPYLSDRQLESAITALDEALSRL